MDFRHFFLLILVKITVIPSYNLTFGVFYPIVRIQKKYGP